MYGRRRRSRPPILLLLIIAAMAGVIFFMLDSQRRSDDAAPAATREATQPVVAAPTTAPAQPTAAPITDPTPATAVANALPSIPQNGTLFIPSAGIYSTIVQAYLDGQSWDVSRLGTNVGHLQGTSWVEHGGNVVLSGHVELADGRQGVFANLDQMALGDLVEITVGDRRWRYIVTEISTTSPDDLTPIAPTREDRLTLITCDSFDFVRNVYLERTIIVAERIG